MSLRPPSSRNSQDYVAGRSARYNQAYGSQGAGTNYYELQRQQERLRVAALLRKNKKK